MNETAIERRIEPRNGVAIMERVLMSGNLQELKPAERTDYYMKVCDSLGLNPLTRPFEYIVLNGKLTLYARKDCTEQLRNIKNVSVRIIGRDVVEDCYVVTARATLPGGREDESTGVVSIGGSKGEFRANAMMKAETKAKRRVTLSICGLGMLDETEIETIPNAAPPKDEAQDQEPATFLDAMFDALDAQGLDEKKQATAQAMARAKYKVKDLNELTETQWGKFLQAIREGKFNQVASDIPGESHPPQGAAGVPSSGPTPAVGSDAAAPEAALTWTTFLAALEAAAMEREVPPSDMMTPINAKVLGLRKKGNEDKIKPETLASWLALAKSGEMWGKGQ